ncbi:MAG: histone deacetylase [Chloroflexi bacterium]|nr:MAG: histone deacetylase [Chloroflexota bacterium]TMD84913.1 MAG: histone deacetylase [Chloroflexota bacterium]
MIALLANPDHSRHRAEGHPERPERVTAILDAIAADRGLTPEPAPSVPDALLHRVHDPQYVAMLDRAAASGGGYLDPDTYITPDSMVAARTAAGAVVEGVDRVLDGRAQHALAVVRPPGHHAEHARAMGFCLLNNVAIGVVAARARNVRRIAVLDIDVHHGNGTQHSFENDADIFYASTHRYPFYPGTGSAAERGRHDNVVNVPLAAGSGDRTVLSAWEKKIGPALAAFRPELILVSAGFDAHRDDPLGGMEVTTDGYRALAGLIKAWATEYSRGRSVWALEGGYDLRAIGDSMVACIDILADRGYNSGSPD